MAYFSDVNLVRVLSMTGCVNQPPVRVDVGSFGVMQPGAIRYIDGAVMTMETPFVYWTIPGHVCAWRTIPGTVRTNIWFGVTGARIQRMHEELRKLSEYDMLPCRNLYPFLSIIRRLEKIQNRTKNSREAQIQIALLIEQFVGEIYRLSSLPKTQSRFAQAISDLAQKIRENPDVSYPFRSIAAEMGLSYDHFRVLFHEFCGSPVHEFCLNARLEAALELLSSDSLSVKEIADQCGFPNASDFARFFRKKVGCSPSAYRRNISL